MRRRNAQSAVNSFASAREGADAPEQSRPLLGLIPYALLLMSLAVLAAAIIVVAWPGRPVPQTAPAPVASEVGRAEKGWIDGR